MLDDQWHEHDPQRLVELIYYFSFSFHVSNMVYGSFSVTGGLTATTNKHVYNRGANEPWNTSFECEKVAHVFGWSKLASAFNFAYLLLCSIVWFLVLLCHFSQPYYSSQIIYNCHSVNHAIICHENMKTMGSLRMKSGQATIAITVEHKNDQNLKVKNHTHI